MNSKVYSIAQLRAVPLDRLPLKNDIVQWINSLNETFYAKVTTLINDEAEFRNYYPTTDSHYCFTSDKINRLVVLDLCLYKNEINIGNVTKNVIDAFLRNEVTLNDNIWYEILKSGEPRIHKRKLICKL